jgi:transposase-like protein
MKDTCPNLNCAAPNSTSKDGFYRRKDDSKYIQRYRCNGCGLRFSSATLTETFGQKRRRINNPLLHLLASGNSQRRCALLLGINRKTVERRLPFLASRCRRKNDKFLNELKGRIHNIQIDDLITKENSKLKPLSVSIAVDEDRRTILAVEVSKIPAFGHLSKIALKKYGERKDEHFEGLTRLFQKIAPIVSSQVLVKSDEHQRYPGFVGAYLPKAKHLQFKSERGCIAGQGELKKIGFDPLFVVNHTCAMLRANVNRLVRKTWCTTKVPMRLKEHIEIFIYYYNQILLKKAFSPL